MSQVYVTQRSGSIDRATGRFEYRDLSAAERYGDLVYVMPSPYDLRSGKAPGHLADPALLPAPMIRHMRHVLRNFSSSDFLLPMGSPAAIVAASVIAREHAVGVVNVLIWDRKDAVYYPSKLEF